MMNEKKWLSMYPDSIPKEIKVPEFPMQKRSLKTHFSPIQTIQQLLFMVERFLIRSFSLHHKLSLQLFNKRVSKRVIV